MNLWKVSTYVLTILLGCVVSLDLVRVAAAFEQPQMRAAEEALHNARDHVTRAEHDHGWHRAAALQSIDKAIAEVHAGIDFADHHN
jgi:hypothetical protein